MHTSLPHSVTVAIALAACSLAVSACSGGAQATPASETASPSDSTSGASSTMTASGGPCDHGKDRPILFLEGAVCGDGTPARGIASSGAGDSWSPAGDRDAYVTPSAKALVTRDQDGTKHVLFKAPRKVSLVHRTAWSPDGTTVAVLLLDEHGVDNSGLIIGTSIPSYRPSLAVIDAETGRVRSRVNLSPATVNMPYVTNPPDTLAFSPDGSQILVSWDSPAVIDLRSGRVQRLWNAPAVATWTPDGHVLFLDVVGRARFGALRSWASHGGTRVLWTNRQLKSKGIVAEHGIEYGQMRFSPDGSTLAIRTVSRGQTGIATAPWSGAAPGEISVNTVTGRVWDFDWSPDGTRIAAVVLDGSTAKVQVLDLAEGTWTRVAEIPFSIDGPDTIDAMGPIKKISWNG